MVLFQPWMLSRSRAPQPTFQQLWANYKGPFDIWCGNGHDAALEWPIPYERRLGYSMEVSCNMVYGRKVVRVNLI